MLVVAGDGSELPRGRLLSVGTGVQAFGRLIADARPLEDWFLVEDGGYPTDIEPLLGIMRSPLWLRRNRYREGQRRTLRQIEGSRDSRGQTRRPRPPLDGRASRCQPRFAAFRGMARRRGNCLPQGSTAGPSRQDLRSAPTELPGEHG